MDIPDDEANVFAIPDFWKSSQWMTRHANSRDRHPFFALNDAKPTWERSSPTKGFFRLPAPLESVVTKDQQSHISPIPSAAVGSQIDCGAVEAEDDPWLCPEQVLGDFLDYKTWEGFEEEHGKDQPPRFLSEASPAALDAWFELGNTSFEQLVKVETCLVDAPTYIDCLLSLCIGRGSTLFAWDAEEKTFAQVISQLKPSGYSMESLNGIIRLCIECGSCVKLLRAFVDKTILTTSCACLIALAGAFDKLLVAMQSELGLRRRDVRSILQLQYLVRPVYKTVRYLHDLVKRVQYAKTDETVISSLLQEARNAEHHSNFMRKAMREVLQMVSKPWTNFVEEWLGVKAEGVMAVTKSGPGRGFVKVGSSIWMNDQGVDHEEPEFVLDAEKMPAFIPQHMAQMIFETGRSLRFLRTHHPNHLLARPSKMTASKPPGLRWEFEWESISRLEKRVKAYEVTLAGFLQDMQTGTITRASDNLSEAPWEDNTCGPATLRFLGQDGINTEAELLSSMRELNKPPSPPQFHELERLVRDDLFGAGGLSPDSEVADRSPHWSLIPLLSFGPLVAAQSRLVNREVARLLFTTHGIRQHLDLQKQYHLLGNGIFCSQLSHALFDPQLDTAERQAGVALSGGVMGLRIGSRDTWPPATSELRLALMGVLSDSYQSSSNTVSSGSSARGAASRLPSDMSFALRNLSPEEIERCIDVDSLEALDFLRLLYKPPVALQSFMTPQILLKYDRLFKLLLRVLRMLFVASQLFRDMSLSRVDSNGDYPDSASSRFRIEAHHFITQITAYFFDTGIAKPWRRFEIWLDHVELGLAGPQGSNGPVVVGPDRLREYHEQVLNDIMRTLLLRKRQQPVLRLLEDIFTVILRFEKMLRGRKRQAGSQASGEDTPAALYSAFRRNVEAFITVCRGLAEKTRISGSGRGWGREDGGSDVVEGIEFLVFMLDPDGFYGK